MAVFDEEKQIKKLNELRKDEEENLARVLSEKYGVNYIDLATVAVNSDALRVVPEAEAPKPMSPSLILLAKK
jgi:hypothetical protein